MHSERDDIEIMSHNKSEKVIKQLFESLLSRYQIGLETLMRGIDLLQ